MMATGDGAVSTIDVWLDAYEYPTSFGSIFNCHGIAYPYDCGRVSFMIINAIFDYLDEHRLHQSIRDKVRFERDITSLHIGYRKYCHHLITKENELPKTKVVKMSIIDTEMNKESQTPKIKKSKITTRKAKAAPLLLFKSSGNSKKRLKKRKMRKKYLWSFKCLILDYLSLQKMKMPDKIVYDSLRGSDHFTKYKVRIKTELSSQPTVSGFDDDALIAEYKAFSNLYASVMREALINEKAMNAMAHKYEHKMSYHQWNKWWFTEMSLAQQNIFNYFIDLREISGCSDVCKAKYFYGRNASNAFDAQSDDLCDDAKQMLWFHAVSFAFRIKRKIANKNLLIMLMASIHSRAEFFEHVASLGWKETMQIMQR